MAAALLAGLSCGLLGLLSAYYVEVRFSADLWDKTFPPRQGSIESTDWSMAFDDGMCALRRWDRKCDHSWGIEDLGPPADFFAKRVLAYYQHESSKHRIAELRCNSLFPFLVLTTPPAVIFSRRAWRARRLRRPGHCRQCGYNLTGNVSGRCPECGAEVTSDDTAGGGDAARMEADTPGRNGGG